VARAAGWALLRAGATLQIAARRTDAAREIAQALAPGVPAGVAIPEAVSLADLAARCGAADVIVNATSVGLGGDPATLDGLSFRAGQVAADLVYGDTAFVRAARAAGARIVTGEEILVRQGALAFTLWTGRPAPEAVMAAALLTRGAR
jgi:shikimate dehydrogenase